MEHPLISLVIHSWSFPSGRGFLDYQRWPEIQVAGIRPMISSRRSRPFLDSMTLTCGHGPWRPWSPGNAALLFVVPAITITIAIYYYCYYYYSYIYIYIIYIINIIYIYITSMFIGWVRLKIWDLMQLNLNTSTRLVFWRPTVSSKVGMLASDHPHHWFDIMVIICYNWLMVVITAWC